MEEDNNKYLKYYDLLSQATSASDLISPNVTYIAGDTEEVLYGWYDDGDPLKIVVDPISGKPVIQKKEPEYVDLGLSVLWAKTNLGASSETDYGKYFQFGDVVGYTGDDAKTHSYWSTCPCNGGASSYDSAYFNAHKSELLDSNNILLPSCDAAHVAYGGDWRLPKKSEVEELLNNTTHSWTTDYLGSGIAGRTFTANGNTLFIPASGGIFNGFVVGGCFYQWSSSLNSDNPEYAFRFFANSYGAEVNSSTRYGGLAIHGVKPKS